jgi:hypothetical protein
VAALRIPEAHALGHLQMMWETSWDHLSPILGDETDTELSAGWVGEPGALAQALLRCGGDGAGFLERNEDGRLVVHDFLEHAPRWVREKLRKRGELAAQGMTISDVKRQAGKAGAAARWGEPAAEDGKSAHVCHEKMAKQMAKNGKSCSSPPLPSLSKEQEEPIGSSPVPLVPLATPVEQVVGIWNETTAGTNLPKARITPTRAKTIQTRLKDPAWFEDFCGGCRFLASSAFHKGENDRGWIADIDFALQAGKATQLAEKASSSARGAPMTRGPAHRAAADQALIDQLKTQEKPHADEPDPDLEARAAEAEALFDEHLAGLPGMRG